MRIFFIFLLFLIFKPGFYAQAQFETQIKDLAFYADAMVNADHSDHRERSAASVQSLISEVLEDPNSFNIGFEQVKWISGLVSPDSIFRIFTWQWMNDRGEYSYAGFVQFRDGKAVWLNPVVSEPGDLDYVILSPDRWYGQLYYELQIFKYGGQIEYMLFGSRRTRDEMIIKTAEPFYIGGDQISFGKELFFDEGRHGKSRISMKYSNTATASLEYDKELKKIVYDNIVSLINPYEAGKVRFVPDGTYKAYKPENGKWYYEANILNDMYLTPPVRDPASRQPKKDLFGR